jgi:hypothetical protein
MNKQLRAKKIKGVCWRCFGAIGILLACGLVLVVVQSENRMSGSQSDIAFAVAGYLLLAVACVVTFRNSCL